MKWFSTWDIFHQIRNTSCSVFYNIKPENLRVSIVLRVSYMNKNIDPAQGESPYSKEESSSPTTRVLCLHSKLLKVLLDPQWGYNTRGCNNSISKPQRTLTNDLSTTYNALSILPTSSCSLSSSGNLDKALTMQSGFRQLDGNTNKK